MVSARMHLLGWLVLMTNIICSISEGDAQARISNKDTGFDKPKGAVKTIESYDTGEVIDCVDIFKQSAFDHPLLKNHITLLKNRTIQMKTGSKGKVNEAGLVGSAFSQAWWKYGECPEGTIPITRLQKHNMALDVKRLNQSKSAVSIHEYAVTRLMFGKFKGAHAKINVWNPRIMVAPEASISQIWLASDSSEGVNTVEAGLMVGSVTYPTDVPRLFVYWTRDGYKKTGCHNLNCPGFVQTSHEICVGAKAVPVSTYGGKQYHLDIDIMRDDLTGRWWLYISNKEVGYWPSEIFTSLKHPAERVDWGGEIFNTRPGGLHTATQMGSGHFPHEGYGKAAYFRNLKIVDNNLILKNPNTSNLATSASRPECYDIVLNRDPYSKAGVNFYYGGPGLSDQCK